jgi:hypothetical protein
MTTYEHDLDNIWEVCRKCTSIIWDGMQGSIWNFMFVIFYYHMHRSIFKYF